MCGRFTLYLTHAEIIALFELIGAEIFSDRYNIAPTQEVIVITLDQDSSEKQGRLMKWGLIPSWSKDSKLAASMINARGETVAEKPAFRAAFKRRRCIIPASGFYEWKKLDTKTKQPYYITPVDDQIFRFAGLWEIWQSPTGEQVHSCTIITTAANSLMLEYHDRMPVILPDAQVDAWLDIAIEDRTVLENMLSQYDSDLMQAWPVSSSVGSVKNQGSDLIKPIN
jgi:putative SOS response-associated peptidase YedK